MKELKSVKLIIIHCTATKCNRPFSTEKLIATGEARFGQVSYHYYIRRDGSIESLLPENVQGIHARHYNHCSLGIVYEGGLNEKGCSDDTRTEAQKASLWHLLQSLKLDYPDAKIIGHRDLPGVSKTCPNFEAKTEYASL